MDTTISLINPKNDLMVQKIKSDIIIKITDDLKTLPLENNNKLNIEFVKYICNLIENLVKKAYKINKKDLAIQIVSVIYPLTNDEKEVIGNMIEFLCNNNMIKKIKLSKKIFYGIGNFIKKKIL